MNFSRVWFWLLLILGLVGCQKALPPTAVPPTSQPTPQQTSQPTNYPTNQPTHPPAPTADSGWQPLQPGLERRWLLAHDAAGQPLERLLILRLQPEQFVFRIAYRPGQPQGLADWQAATGALLLVNGGFFTPAFEATGLIIVDGQASGRSYEGFGGMLTINDAGVPALQGLAERPFTPDPTIQYALQSFPLLVQHGIAVYTDEDGQTARRTVVAQDENGRWLFILAPYGGFTLAQLSAWLAASDLGIEIALNLDGGTSTGLLMDGAVEVVPAFTLLPAVITVGVSFPN